MPFDIPMFNAINDRQYIRPTYVDPMTGGLTYSNPAMMPAMSPAPAPAPMPSYGGMPGGGDFFSQLAGLFGGMQQAARQPMMGATDRLAQARAMPQVTGYGYGGGNRPLEQETRMRDAAQRKASMTGQFGRASGGRSRPRASNGFMPSASYGKPSVAEGFGDGRGFGGFR